MKARVTILTLFLFLWLLLWGTAQAQEHKWFDLSNFDPFGHALDNVEEAIPGLWLKGIIWNNTGVYISGRGEEFRSHVMRGNPVPPPPGSYNPNPGLASPSRKRNWNFYQIEWFTELEARYVPPEMPQLEIVSIWDFRYNALYDWDHSFKHNFGPTSGALRRNLYPAVKEADEYYNDTKRIWREFYVKWTPPGWIIQLGKQQHNWAKVDTKVHDTAFSPMDLRYGSTSNPLLTQTDFEYTTIPTWMLSITRQFGTNYYFQLMWNFDYERNYFYPGGYVIAKSLAPSALEHRYRADMPTWNIRDHEWHMRFGFMIGRWNGHLFYSYNWDKSLTKFRRGLIDGGPRYYVEPKPTRLHTIGLALDTNFWFLGRNWAMFFENKFELNKYLLNLMESPYALGLFNPLLNKYDGVTKRTLYTQLWGVETFFLRDFSLLLYNAHVHLLGRDGGIPAPAPNSPSPSIDLFYLPAISWKAPQFEDRLVLSYIQRLTMFTKYQTYTTLSASYTFSNYLSAKVLFHLYWGDPAYTPWGQWQDRDVVEFKVKYEF